jgi:hypothetical protein
MKQLQRQENNMVRMICRKRVEDFAPEEKRPEDVRGFATEIAGLWSESASYHALSSVR